MRRQERPSVEGILVTTSTASELWHTMLTLLSNPVHSNSPQAYLYTNIVSKSKFPGVNKHITIQGHQQNAAETIWKLINVNRPKLRGMVMKQQWREQVNGGVPLFACSPIPKTLLRTAPYVMQHAAKCLRTGRIKLFGAPRQWKHFRPLFQAVFLSGGGVLPPRLSQTPRLPVPRQK